MDGVTRDSPHSLSTVVHKFSHVFLSSFGVLSLDFIEQLSEVVAGELPAEGLGDGLIVVLEVEEAFFQGAE